MAVIHKVGEPENEAERLTIGLLKARLPHNYIVFHNLETVSSGGFAYQIDLLVIAPHAVYVVEEKNYHGHIRGNIREWQMFNGAVFPSPIPTTNRKARVVATQLKNYDPRLANVFCQGVVHLSSTKAKLKIRDPQEDRVTIGEELVDYLTDPRRLPIGEKDFSSRLDRICAAIFSGFNPSPPTKEIGVYNIIEKLGATPEYTEYLAEHRYLKIEPRTRLKVYHFNIYQEKVNREKQLELIFRDMNALKKLAGHPNIVRTSDIFPWEGESFVLPTEWIDGFCLRGLLDDPDKPLTEIDKFSILSQLCRGLDYAHQHGVVHRNLRPENVIVCNDGTIKITNFDFARIADLRVETIAAEIDGQLDERYIAPEVLASPAKASAQSDLYSVGIMLYEIICGETPYSSARELLARRDFNWEVSSTHTDRAAEINEVLHELCAFAPEWRLAGAAEAAEKINRLNPVPGA